MDIVAEALHCQCGSKFSGWVEEDPTTGRITMIGDIKTRNGWWVCSRCKKPSLQCLNDCDTCGKKFKGIRPGLKFAYTCPECE